MATSYKGYTTRAAHDSNSSEANAVLADLLKPMVDQIPTGGARSIDVTEMIQAFDWDDNELDADSYITPIDGASQGDS